MKTFKITFVILSVRHPVSEL